MVKVELICNLKLANGKVEPIGTVYEGETIEDFPNEIKKEFVLRNLKVLKIHSDGKKKTKQTFDPNPEDGKNSTITINVTEPVTPQPIQDGESSVTNETGTESTIIINRKENDGDVSPLTNDENETSDTNVEDKVEENVSPQTENETSDSDSDETDSEEDSDSDETDSEEDKAEEVVKETTSKKSKKSKKIKI